MNLAILQKTRTVKFIKSLRLKWFCHVKRMQNQRMPKQIAAAKVEGTRERGRPRRRWRDEVLEASVHSGL